MKNAPQLTFILLTLILSMEVSAASRHSVLVDAESFSNLGGWVIDQQATQVLGSPYIMAHGLGKPVEDAVTEVSLPHGGQWYVYVRTYNWTSPWCEGEGPGAFLIAVDGENLQNTCGTSGNQWMWQYAGRFECSAGSISVAVKDIKGFDGRCDALYFSDREIDPGRLPNDFDSLTRLRRKLIKGYGKPEIDGHYDIVVTGAGLAGISTAVSAARLGLKVALVHDRPVLGGNNSTEIRVRMGGGICKDPYPNLGNLLLEYAHDETPSARAPEKYQEWKKESIIANEQNITLFRNYRAEYVSMKGSCIKSVFARNIASGKLIKLTAPLFADCTGDGNLGFMAGADYSIGREAKATFNEETAPAEADNNVIGASVQWQTKLCDGPVPFPEFNYGLQFNDKNVYRDTEGRWNWETGWDKDMVYDVERIRDLELLGIYSNWSYLKNHSSSAEEFACRELDWVAFLLGKRESRRLLGDVIYNETDIDNKVEYEDGAVTITWPIDLHFASPQNESRFPGRAFRATSKHKKTKPFVIPYRCFYSRNVDNLFMAGRDISVSHVAMGATRVMRTNSVMGEVVGMAASICKAHRCLPRAVYTDHLDELKHLMSEGVGKKGQPNTQDFYIK